MPAFTVNLYQPTFIAIVTNFGQLEHKICHNSACIRCITKMLVSNRQFLESHARWHLGLHFSMAVVDAMVTNVENIIVFVSSATDCF